MGLYEMKMHIKKLPVVKFLLFRRIQKEEKRKKMALKEDGLALISDVEKVLGLLNLVYFADFGTLLGIVRDKDFISWDTDIDYGIVIPEGFDWKWFEDEMNKASYEKIRQFCIQGKVTEQTYQKGDLTIDFFGHFNMDGKGCTYVYYRKNNYIYHSKYEYHAVKGLFAEIQEVRAENFKGINVNIPVNSEEYLESVYTKKWRTPDPNWNGNTKYNREKMQCLGYLENKK